MRLGPIDYRPASNRITTALLVMLVLAFAAFAEHSEPEAGVASDTDTMVSRVPQALIWVW